MLQTSSSLLSKWRYSAPSEISTARAMSRTLVSVTPWATKSAMAVFSMRSRVSVNRCLGIVSKRLFTITASSAIVKSPFLGDASPFPPQSGDARIRGEPLSRELQPPLGKLADGAGAVRIQIEAPRFPSERLGPRERAAREQGDVDPSGIAG